MKIPKHLIQKLSSVLLAAVLGLSLAACGGKTGAPAQSNAAPSTSPAGAASDSSGAVSGPTSASASAAQTPDPDKTVVLAAPRDLTPGEKDGYYCSLILQVWEPLARLGADGSPEPALAESWQMSEDGKEWTLKLKSGVKFHDGEPFNAEAVVANINRVVQHGPKRSPFYTLDAAKTYPGLVEAEAVSEDTVKLVFDVPSPTAIHRLTNFGSPMVSPKCLDDAGDFGSVVQGTGPFRIVEHEPDQYTVLEAFDGYYGSPAKVKRVRVLSMPNAETRGAALRAGEIVGVLDIGAILASQAHAFSQDPDFEVSSKRSTISHFMQINHERPYLDQPDLVRAMSLAIDRELIVREFYYNYAVASANPLNASEEGYVQDRPVYDLEQAKTLAKGVLGDARIELELLVPQYGLDRYPYKEQAEYIQAALSEIGIDVKITILEGSEQMKLRKEGAFDMALHTQGMPDGDPVTMLKVFMGPNNSGRYQNETAVQMLNEAAQELDGQKRIQAYKALQDLALETLPTLPLFHDHYLVVHHKSLKGYEATAYGVTLSDMYWDSK